MTFESDQFEKQIKRIHDVLVQDHAEVTWNDRIPDPDNPKQLRQIDVTIKRNGEITHVECRKHQATQNSKWIEELYGRKISLKAEAMIGVSSSGFTEGAIKKARRLGIFLCNLNELTDKEIESWGKKTKIKLYYYTFSNLEICYFFDSIKGMDIESTKKDLFSKPEYNDDLFNQTKYHFNKNKNYIYPYGFNFGKIAVENIKILGRTVLCASLRGDVDKVSFEYECPSVQSFHVPLNSNEVIASIEKSEPTGIEIIKSKSGFSKLFFDLNAIPLGPPNSVFAGIVTISKMVGSKEYPPLFELVGKQEKEVFINEAKYVFAELKQ